MARSAAAVALDAGDAALAVAEARAAVAAAESISACVDAAKARCLLGQARALAGDSAQAVAELGRAAADFDGTPGYRDRAEDDLRALGHRVAPRRAPAGAEGAGVDALSRRELEVARLVVDRRTNPEIASDLFLGLKAVETHMRNIFRKLGGSSRADVARVLERSTVL